MLISKPGEGTKIYYPTVILEGDGHEVHIGNNCSIGQFSFIAARKFIMEDNSEIGPSVIIGGGGDVTLMKSSTVTYGAKLIPATFTTEGKYMNDNVHNGISPLVDTITYEPNTCMIRGSITIGEGAYIGSGAIICVSDENPHIKIGDFAVIGALTYIDEDVPARSVVHSNKALIWRKRNEMSERNKKM